MDGGPWSLGACVVVKGVHSPYCLPDVIATQLTISLERLQIERAPIYIMHRDNPDVPVDEFVDALNALHAKGLIETFGGSNWSVAASKKPTPMQLQGLQPLKILNNNLSLAVMKNSLGRLYHLQYTGNAWLFEETGTTHLSWSSQARGYFLQPGQGPPCHLTRPGMSVFLPKPTQSVVSEQLNWQRKGNKGQNIATAWVLGQRFPSLALIGPRSPSEIATTLPAMTVSLSAAEVAWLNLESSER